MNTATFTSYCDLCEEVHSIAKRPDKSVVVADYLSILAPDELLQVCRSLSGSNFPIRDHHTINVSGVVILTCLAACAGVPLSFAKERLHNSGDLGSLAYELFSGGLTIAVFDSLTLVNIFQAIDEICTMVGNRKKSRIVTDILRRCTPLEAKYFVRMLCSNLDIGLNERDVEEAISRWKDINFGLVQSANMLLGDIGETALLCLNNEIDQARMKLYKPVNYMHATEVSSIADLARFIDERYVVEEKYDGLRAQIHIGLDMPGSGLTCGVVYDCLRIAIYSDKLKDVTNEFVALIPGLAALLTDSAGTVDAVGVILDGVIVPARRGEILPFDQLRKMLDSRDEIPTQSDTQIAYVAFDQLFAEGWSLIQEEWYARTLALDKIHFDNVTTFRAVSVTPATIKEIQERHIYAITTGAQGLVLKNPRSCYRPDRRGNDWIKISADSAILT